MVMGIILLVCQTTFKSTNIHQVSYPEPQFFMGFLPLCNGHGQYILNPADLVNKFIVYMGFPWTYFEYVV